MQKRVAKIYSSCSDSDLAPSLPRYSRALICSAPMLSNEFEHRKFEIRMVRQKNERRERCLVRRIDSLGLFPLQVLGLNSESGNLALYLPASPINLTDLALFSAVCSFVEVAIALFHIMRERNKGAQKAYNLARSAIISLFMCGISGYFVVLFSVADPFSEWFRIASLLLAAGAFVLASWNALHAVFSFEKKIGLLFIGAASFICGFFVAYFLTLYISTNEDENSSWRIVFIVGLTILIMNILLRCAFKAHYRQARIKAKPDLYIWSIGLFAVVAISGMFCISAEISNSPGICTARTSNPVVSNSYYLSKYNLVLNPVERAHMIEDGGNESTLFYQSSVYDSGCELVSTVLTNSQNNPVIYASIELDRESKLLDFLHEKDCPYTSAAYLNPSLGYMPTMLCELEQSSEGEDEWMIWFYEKDSSGKTIIRKTNIYSAVGELLTEYIRNYDDAGVLISCEEFDSDGNLVCTRVPEYQDGDLVRLTTYDASHQFEFVSVKVDDTLVPCLIRFNDMELPIISPADEQDDPEIGAIRFAGSSESSPLTISDALSLPSENFEIQFYYLSENGEEVESDWMSSDVLKIYNSMDQAAQGITKN